MTCPPRTITILAALIWLAACGKTPVPQAYQGYAEGEYVRVGAPVAGTLVRLQVVQGDRVKLGDPLFVLEQENESAARLEAENRVTQAQARLADLEKGKRPDEIAAVVAQNKQAEAALALSRANLERAGKLVAAGFLSPSALDEARSAQERDQARLAESGAQLKVARLAAREDTIQAARAEVRGARASLAQAQWKLGQKTQPAPVAGTVEDRLYLPGEYVPAGSPVVSLLPPENIKLRFFLPETVLARVRLGGRVLATCDGCGGDIPATVSFVSTQAEYTPPVIYNRENRTKLVYLVEARPAPKDAARLHPGQPVDVRLP